MTCIRDPNPHTCTALLPSNVDVNKKAQETDCSVPTAARSIDELNDTSLDDTSSIKTLEWNEHTPWQGLSQKLDKANGSPVNSEVETEPERESQRVQESPHHSPVKPPADPCNVRTQAPQQKDDASSCNTVCKPSLVWDSKGPVKAIPDFVTFCRREGFSHIVRANYSNEHGLAEIGGSYERSDFLEYGIDHLECPIMDTNGGIPNKQLIRRVVEWQDENSDLERRVLIHCKGGFGRSVVLACCLMIHWYDIPGRALLGWVRILRPGSITMPQQERLLCSLEGREDLANLLKSPTKCACTIA
jgi:hypothetical protein